jgi:hypothetical protein
MCGKRFGLWAAWRNHEIVVHKEDCELVESCRVKLKKVGNSWQFMGKKSLVHWVYSHVDLETTTDEEEDKKVKIEPKCKKMSVKLSSVEEKKEVITQQDVRQLQCAYCGLHMATVLHLLIHETQVHLF